MIEVELKYRVTDPATGERLLAADQLAGLQAIGGRARAVQMEDRYVDTRDGALAQAGFAVRLRQSGDGTIVTVKSLAAGEGEGGAIEREELEGPADRVAAAADWPASDARALVLEHAGDAPLVERVTVRQLRHKRMLRAGDSRIELSLDEVDVISRGRIVRSFTELEAELVKGDASLLAGLADRLDTEAGLTRSGESKLELALAAVHGSNGEAGSGGRPSRKRRSGNGHAPNGADNADRPAPKSQERPGPQGDRTKVDATNADAGATDDADADRDADPDADADAAADPDADAGPNAVATDDPGADAHAAADPGAGDAHEERARDDDLRPSETPRLVVGKSPGVMPEDHLAEAGRKVMRFHLAKMLEREPGVREGRDPEEVHKMRVATRRQRAAWRLFGESFRKKRTQAYRSGLRDLAQRLGAVRDLDVQLETIETYRADLPVPEQRAIEPLVAAWRQHRDDARVLLLRELDSQGHARFIDDYLDFVRTDGAGVTNVGPAEPHRVRDTAPSRIWAAYEHVRGYESVLRWADVPTLHELRIASKRLRYSLEFVQEALGEESKPLIERVTSLQDQLGMMNDADVAASMARTFLVEHASQLSQLESAAIGRYLVDREREVGRLRRGVGAPWRRVAGATFRRSLGRVVAGL